MKKQKLLLLVLVFLLISAGIVAAQSSTNYVMQRFVLAGGGETANSPNFAVTSVIGQLATDLGNSSNYKVSGGFLFPLQPGFNFDNQLFLPTILK